MKRNKPIARRYPFESSPPLQRPQPHDDDDEEYPMTYRAEARDDLDDSFYSTRSKQQNNNNSAFKSAHEGTQHVHYSLKTSTDAAEEEDSFYTRVVPETASAVLRSHVNYSINARVRDEALLTDCSVLSNPGALSRRRGGERGGGERRRRGAASEQAAPFYDRQSIMALASPASSASASASSSHAQGHSLALQVVKDTPPPQCWVGLQHYPHRRTYVPARQEKEDDDDDEDEDVYRRNSARRTTALKNRAWSEDKKVLGWETEKQTLWRRQREREAAREAADVSQHVRGLDNNNNNTNKKSTQNSEAYDRNLRVFARRAREGEALSYTSQPPSADSSLHQQKQRSRVSLHQHGAAVHVERAPPPYAHLFQDANAYTSVLVDTPQRSQFQQQQQQLSAVEVVTPIATVENASRAATPHLPRESTHGKKEKKEEKKNRESSRQRTQESTPEEEKEEAQDVECARSPPSSVNSTLLVREALDTQASIIEYLRERLRELENEKKAQREQQQQQPQPHDNTQRSDVNESLSSDVAAHDKRVVEQLLALLVASTTASVSPPPPPADAHAVLLDIVKHYEALATTQSKMLTEAATAAVAVAAEELSPSSSASSSPSHHSRVHVDPVTRASSSKRIKASKAQKEVVKVKTKGKKVKSEESLVTVEQTASSSPSSSAPHARIAPYATAETVTGTVMSSLVHRYIAATVAAQRKPVLAPSASTCFENASSPHAYSLPSPSSTSRSSSAAGARVVDVYGGQTAPQHEVPSHAHRSLFARAQVHGSSSDGRKSRDTRSRPHNREVMPSTRNTREHVSTQVDVAAPPLSRVSAEGSGKHELSREEDLSVQSTLLEVVESARTTPPEKKKKKPVAASSRFCVPPPSAPSAVTRAPLPQQQVLDFAHHAVRAARAASRVRAASVVEDAALSTVPPPLMQTHPTHADHDGDAHHHDRKNKNNRNRHERAPSSSHLAAPSSIAVLESSPERTPDSSVSWPLSFLAPQIDNNAANDADACAETLKNLKVTQVHTEEGGADRAEKRRATQKVETDCRPARDEENDKDDDRPAGWHHNETGSGAASHRSEPQVQPPRPHHDVATGTDTVDDTEVAHGASLVSTSPMTADLLGRSMACTGSAASPALVIGQDGHCMRVARRTQQTQTRYTQAFPPLTDAHFDDSPARRAREAQAVGESFAQAQDHVQRRTAVIELHTAPVYNAEIVTRLRRYCNSLESSRQSLLHEVTAAAAAAAAAATTATSATANTFLASPARSQRSLGSVGVGAQSGVSVLGTSLASNGNAAGHVRRGRAAKYFNTPYADPEVDATLHESSGDEAEAALDVEEAEEKVNASAGETDKESRRRRPQRGGLDRSYVSASSFSAISSGHAREAMTHGSLEEHSAQVLLSPALEAVLGTKIVLQEDGNGGVTKTIVVEETTGGGAATKTTESEAKRDPLATSVSPQPAISIRSTHRWAGGDRAARPQASPQPQYASFTTLPVHGVTRGSASSSLTSAPSALYRPLTGSLAAVPLKTTVAVQDGDDDHDAAAPHHGETFCEGHLNRPPNTLSPLRDDDVSTTRGSSQGSHLPREVRRATLPPEHQPSDANPCESPSPPSRTRRTGDVQGREDGSPSLSLLSSPSPPRSANQSLEQARWLWSARRARAEQGTTTTTTTVRQKDAHEQPDGAAKVVPVTAEEGNSPLPRPPPILEHEEEKWPSSTSPSSVRPGSLSSLQVSADTTLLLAQPGNTSPSASGGSRTARAHRHAASITSIPAGSPGALTMASRQTSTHTASPPRQRSETEHPRASMPTKAPHTTMTTTIASAAEVEKKSGSRFKVPSPQSSTSAKETFVTRAADGARFTPHAHARRTGASPAQPIADDSLPPPPPRNDPIAPNRVEASAATPRARSPRRVLTSPPREDRGVSAQFMSFSSYSHASSADLETEFFGEASEADAKQSGLWRRRDDARAGHGGVADVTSYTAADAFDDEEEEEDGGAEAYSESTCTADEVTSIQAIEKERIDVDCSRSASTTSSLPQRPHHAPQQGPAKPFVPASEEEEEQEHVGAKTASIPRAPPPPPLHPVAPADSSVSDTPLHVNTIHHRSNEHLVHSTRSSFRGLVPESRHMSDTSQDEPHEEEEEEDEDEDEKEEKREQEAAEHTMHRVRGTMPRSDPTTRERDLRHSHSHNEEEEAEENAKGDLTGLVQSPLTWSRTGSSTVVDHALSYEGRNYRDEPLSVPPPLHTQRFEEREREEQGEEEEQAVREDEFRSPAHHQTRLVSPSPDAISDEEETDSVVVVDEVTDQESEGDIATTITATAHLQTPDATLNGSSFDDLSPHSLNAHDNTAPPRDGSREATLPRAHSNDDESEDYDIAVDVPSRLSEKPAPESSSSFPVYKPQQQQQRRSRSTASPNSFLSNLSFHTAHSEDSSVMST